MTPPARDPAASASPVGAAGVVRRLPLRRDGVLRLAGPFPLTHGGALADAEIGYARFGDPALPTVLVLGGISAGRNVVRHGETDRAGWWEAVVGEGLAVDTSRVSVLGVDFLGGPGAASGPNGAAFPSIDTADQARAIIRVLDHLGIERLHAAVGSSYGGMVALAFASLFGERVSRILVIGAAHESHPMATALRALQRRVVRLGAACGRAGEGVALARAIAMTTYRTPEEFAARFGGEPVRSPDGFRFPVEGYLEHHGASFARRFAPASFLCLSESLDLHRVDPSRIRVPTTLLAVEGDTLVPLWQMRELERRLGGPRRLVEVRSIYGHDAFLKDIEPISRVVRDALFQGGVP